MLIGLKSIYSRANLKIFCRRTRSHRSTQFQHNQRPSIGASGIRSRQRSQRLGGFSNSNPGRFDGRWRRRARGVKSAFCAGLRCRTDPRSSILRNLVAAISGKSDVRDIFGAVCLILRFFLANG
jgi:hypothetical protein